MNYLNSLKYNNTLPYDLINKFVYKNVSELPKLEKINLNFCVKKVDLNLLVASLVALELLSHQRGFLIKSGVLNLTSKIKKGDPIGSKVVLRNAKALQFLLKLRKNLYVLSKLHTKCFSFQIKNLMFFKEIEVNYHFFRKLTPLNVNITTTTKTNAELIFLLRSYGLKIQYCKNNLRVEFNLAKVGVRVRVSFFANGISD